MAMQKEDIKVGDMVLLPARVVEVFGGIVRVKIHAVNALGEPRAMGGCVLPELIKRKVGGK